MYFVKYIRLLILLTNSFINPINAAVRVYSVDEHGVGRLQPELRVYRREAGPRRVEAGDAPHLG